MGLSSVKEVESMCTPATLTHGWIVICVVSISFVLLRLSIDVIQTANQKTRKHFRESHHATTEEKAAPAKEEKSSGTTGGNSYGSIQDGVKDSDEEEMKVAIDENIEETDRLLSSSQESEGAPVQLIPGFPTRIKNYISILSLRFQGILVLALLAVSMLNNIGASCVLSKGIVWSCITIILFGAILTYRDPERERFGYLARILYLATTLTLTIPITTYYYRNRISTFTGDEVIVNVMCLYILLVIGESIFVPMNGARSSSGDNQDGGKLSTFAIVTLLKPYVWPDKTADSAFTNRIRASMTWVCVILSKACNLSAPVLVSSGLSFSAPLLFGCWCWHSFAMHVLRAFHSQMLTISLVCFDTDWKS